MRRYALRDDQWERIKDLLPGREGHVGVTTEDNRLFCRGGALPVSRRHSPKGAHGARRISHFDSLWISMMRDAAETAISKWSVWTMSTM